MKKNIVAINYIQCEPSFTERFETLFATRAHEIDKSSGFINMEVLRPAKEEDAYLIVSHWETKNDFEKWMKSNEFIKGHSRGFRELKEAKEKGLPQPMTSQFKVYEVISE